MLRGNLAGFGRVEVMSLVCVGALEAMVKSGGCREDIEDLGFRVSSHSDAFAKIVTAQGSMMQCLPETTTQ